MDHFVHEFFLVFHEVDVAPRLRTILLGLKKILPLFQRHPALHQIIQSTKIVLIKLQEVLLVGFDGVLAHIRNVVVVQALKVLNPPQLVSLYLLHVLLDRFQSVVVHILQLS